MERMIVFLLMSALVGQGTAVCSPAEDFTLRPAMVCGGEKGQVEKDLNLIGMEGKRIVWKFLVHIFAHKAFPLFDHIDNLIRLLSSERYKQIVEEGIDEVRGRIEEKIRLGQASKTDLHIINLLDGMSEYGDWRVDKLRLLREPEADLDIDTLLQEHFEEFSNLQKIIIETLEWLQEEKETTKEKVQISDTQGEVRRDSIKDVKGEDLLKILEIVAEHTAFIELIDALETTDINTLILLYLKIGRAGTKDDYYLDLCKEELIFDKIIEDEQFILIGIIDNLIMNAFAAKTMGVKVRTDRESEEWIRIEVLDTGIGILKEDLHHIFEEGFTTKESSNAGVGLSETLRYFRLRREIGGGGKIQVDTKNRKAEVLRLIFDEDLKEIRILEEDEIPDDELRRKIIGTTFTICLPARNDSPSKPPDGVVKSETNASI